MNKLEEIKNKIAINKPFDITIADLDNDCCINMGFGYIPGSVLAESVDDEGNVMADDIMSVKQALLMIADFGQNPFFNVTVNEEVNTGSIAGKAAQI
jgi:hypothetical protein